MWLAEEEVPFAVPLWTAGVGATVIVMEVEEAADVTGAEVVLTEAEADEVDRAEVLTVTPAAAQN